MASNKSTAALFDTLRIWAQLSDDDLARNVTASNIDTLHRISELLDRTGERPTEWTSAKFVALVRRLHGLLVLGSRQLGDAIIEAQEHLDAGNQEQAKNTYRAYLSQDPAPFFETIARHRLEEL